MFNFGEMFEKYGITEEQFNEICSLIDDATEKGSTPDWKAIREKYNIDCSSESVRKSSQGLFGGVFRLAYYKYKLSLSSSTDEDSYMKELNVKIRELEKEKVKTREERTAYKKLIREQAKKESTIEMVQRIIEEHRHVPFEYIPHDTVSGDSTEVIFLTDLHSGIDIKNCTNVYNTDILKRRLSKLLDDVKDIQKTHKSSECVLLLGGDLISGLIHLSLRIENNEDVVEQVESTSDLISGFTYELSKIFNKVDVYSVSGNHSRVTANKDDSLRGENLDRLISFCMKKDFRHIDNVNINNCLVDDDIAHFLIKGYSVYLTHGDKDTVQNVEYNMTKFAKKLNKPLPDIIYIGHRHTNGLTTVNNTKIIESGCVSGSDDYCLTKRLLGTPEQTVSIITEKSGLKCLYDIQLD